MLSRAEVSQSLIENLRLAQPPVAVAFADSAPAGVETWSGAIPAGCRFWQEAGRRVFVTSPDDHAFCAIGQYTHNLGVTSMDDLATALKVFADLTYVRERDLAMVPVLSRQVKHVIYGPLALIPVEPDVVLLFVGADQALVLSEASQQIENGLPPAMGRPACAIIPHATNSGRSALSLGCCGARAYLDVLSSDVALYAIPGGTVAAFAERIAALAKANDILTKFHRIRRQTIESGNRPTVQDSLVQLQSGA